MNAKPLELVVHATHEAGFKIGGIGAVLDGLLSARAYTEAVPRTILVGTINTSDAGQMMRLTEPRNRMTLYYSSWHKINTPPPVLPDGTDWDTISSSLRAIEAMFKVHIMYGRRAFRGVEHEVLLVDASHADIWETNRFKYDLWDHYAIASERYEMLDEYDMTIKAARPSLAALQVLAGPKGAGRRVILAHEWMGLPLAYCAQIEEGETWYLAFYAHEMATARILVEDEAGHDTRFYNVLRLARAQGLSMDMVFGDRSDYFKHALIKQTPRLDAILAVGDWVVEELRFTGPAFEMIPIDLAYNGVPFERISLTDKLASKAKLQRYAEALFGFKPDYVFSHVTRLVVSKGLWRDLRVLEHLDAMLAAEGKTAVHFVLSTSAHTGRKPEDVRRWEKEYGWPVYHRSDNGDLVWLEIPFYEAVAAFNAKSQAIKVVLVNQYGWDREHCGERMPEDMGFADLRRGSDAEFGQSVYEPFGIAQVEPLGFGALCIVSNVCGCVGFVQRAAQAAGVEPFENLIVADYVTLPPTWATLTLQSALALNQNARDALEVSQSRNVAEQMRDRLPHTQEQMQLLLERGQRVAEHMSWEVVARDYLLPALTRAR